MCGDTLFHVSQFKTWNFFVFYSRSNLPLQTCKTKMDRSNLSLQICKTKMDRSNFLQKWGKSNKDVWHIGCGCSKICSQGGLKWSKMPIFAGMKLFYSFLLAGLAFALCPAGLLAQNTKKNYRLVFYESFNQPDGSRPDPEKWMTSRRGTSAWNRWISPSVDVAFISGGKLVLRAIRNASQPGDTARMLTGAVETMGKFAFQYGRIEVKAKTKGHTGNFPAIWLMPQPPAPLHPYGGEIDIFETINDENKAYHTVHTNWTLKLHHTQPKNSFNEKVKVGRWHVYGLEWTPEELVWMVDGKAVGVYRKSKDSEAIAAGQWPFDHPFYLILNQSVGMNGGWAAPPDEHFIYETRFDWVKVYSRE